MDQIPENLEMRRSWNRLALAMDRPEVFYTYEWAIGVQRAYRSALAPCIVAAYEGDLLMGVVALAGKRSKTGELSFLTADTADYCDFLSAPSGRQEFIEGVLSELKHPKTAKIVLTNLPADSCSVAALSQAAASCQYHLHLRPAYLCARVTFGSAEQRSSVKQSILTKKRLRRNLRELGKRGTVSVRHDTNWDQVAPLLESFSRAHVARFLETGKVSNLIRGERRAFLRELARELSQSGWLVLSRLLVGDMTAAWNYGFQFAGSWFWYQPTINNNYGNFTPGYCLLAEIIELACESPDVEVVDLGLGAEEYKDRFATANRQTLYCELNKSFSGHLRSVLRNRAATLAKASPRTESMIRVMISQAAALKARLRSRGLWNSFVWLVRRTRTSMFGFDDVLFFEWPAGARTRGGSGVTLRPLDSDLVGSAAILYGDDPAALRYLVRSAQRLGSRHDEGFALLNTEGQPVHFCWAANFEGFAMAELDCRLHAPCPDAVMIFDCFTPVCARGHGWFAEAIGLLADYLRSQGKVPWIFGAARNQSSLRGIRKSAFEYRFSLGRRRLFFFSRTKDSIPASRSGSRASSVPTL
jgi:CelD/BcsL family acetyltransferase involved in cellulose biosynthesis